MFASYYSKYCSKRDKIIMYTYAEMADMHNAFDIVVHALDTSIYFHLEENILNNVFVNKSMDRAKKTDSITTTISLFQSIRFLWPFKIFYTQ